MRTFAHSLGILGALVLASSAGTAAAQRPCSVTIVRAPDRVRATVEAWVEREPSCSVVLEVRIVPTDGGLYVLARDERGRTYERIVPDEQSAGVLVASWMADDSMPSAPRRPPPVVVELPAVESARALVETATRADRRAPSRWLAVDGLVGASIGSGGFGGVRADLDFASVGNWYLGASLAVAQGNIALTAIGPTATEVGALQSTSSLKAVAYAVRPIELGSWHVRPAIGLGVLGTTVHVVDHDFPASVMNQTLNTVTPMGELAFVVARDVGESWAIEGGLVIDIDPQTIEATSTSAGGMAYMTRTIDVVLALGVGRRL